MTVEELNIKISADADRFKAEIAAANAAMKKFRDDAEEAGRAVTEAFDGLITAEMNTADIKGNAVPVGDDGTTDGNGTAAQKAYGIPSYVPAENISFNSQNSFRRTANVLDLDSNETVIGAVAENGRNDSQPVNITTTVELDGDKVGESVNRFNMRRSKITNGMYG